MLTHKLTSVKSIFLGDPVRWNFGDALLRQFGFGWPDEGTSALVTGFDFLRRDEVSKSK